ncbi:MAG: AIR synthase related protein [Candidatus Altiarchaeota archaeon]
MREDLPEKFVDSLLWIREELLEMDTLAEPVLGITAWDDPVVHPFGSKQLLVSADGPYTKRLVMKSALVHASTDVIVKGGRPLFALDCLIGEESDVREMIRSLKRQALSLKIPLLGGNTLFEDAEPRCTLAVIGDLLLDEPIRDDGARPGDVIALVGEPIWGEQEERLEKAKLLFKTWYAILKKTKINSSKDVTKGGLVSVVYEMERKSGRKFKLEEKIPYSITRNLDNFLVTLPEQELHRLEKICRKHDCPHTTIGRVV